jgi:hypothetical protein
MSYVSDYQKYVTPDLVFRASHDGMWEMMQQLVKPSPFTRISEWFMGVNTYTQFQRYTRSMSNALAGACRGGQISMIDYIVSKMGKSFITKPVVRWDVSASYLEYACVGGDMKTVQHVMDLGDKSYNNGFVSATMGGHRGIAEYMLKLGASDVNTALRMLANKWIYPEMIDWVVSLGANNFQEVLMCICRENLIPTYESKFEAVKRLLEYGATDINAGFRAACRTRYHELINILIIHGATDINGGLINACSGYIDIVRMLLDLGATAYNRGLTIACLYGNLDIAKLMVENGAYSFYRTRYMLTNHHTSRPKCIAYINKLGREKYGFMPWYYNICNNSA